MSVWAYKKCNKCGNRTHINSICECGGDPWFVEDQTRTERIRIKKIKAEYLQQIEHIDDEINWLNKRIQSL